jgi:hypothetical protein
MSVCIIGCGVAGTLACLELVRLGKQVHEITLIDPYFDGGALGRQWGAIYSNTRWEQITDAMSQFPTAQKTIQELSVKYTPDSRVLLHDLGWLLQDSLRPLLSELNVLVDTCQAIREIPDGWEVELTSGKRSFQLVFICQGGKQKLLDFGKPILALDVALDPARLRRIVRPNQSVAVFGLAHSGTLICKHLLDQNVKVYGIHKGEKPFLFARDDEYDGIKQESAEIADNLLQAPPTNFEFVRYQDTPKLVKVLTKVHWIVSATGFEGSPIQIFTKEGTNIPWDSYSPETAQIAPSLFGFGLAYPGVTTINERIYKDISIPSFVQQIRRCLPTILSKS